MATVSFSVPDELKERFNRAFARENKSRVIARLMMRAVEERNLQRTRARAIDALLNRGKDRHAYRRHHADAHVALTLPGSSIRLRDS